MVWFYQRHSQRGPYKMSYEVEQALSAALAALNELLENQRENMADLSYLRAALAANTQAVMDLQAEVARLKDISGTDQAAVDELTAGLTTNNAAMEALKPPPPPPPAAAPDVTAPST